MSENFAAIFEEAPKKGASLNPEEAIQIVCRAASVIIATKLQLRSGILVKNTFYGRIDGTAFLEQARTAASILKTCEQQGRILSYKFSEEDWAELLSVTHDIDVQDFVNHQLCRPEMLWRCILA